jgi:hypothetical protein
MLPWFIWHGQRYAGRPEVFQRPRPFRRPEDPWFVLKDFILLDVAMGVERVVYGWDPNLLAANEAAMDLLRTVRR